MGLKKQLTGIDMEVGTDDVTYYCYTALQTGLHTKVNTRRQGGGVCWTLGLPLSMYPTALSLDFRCGKVLR